MNSDDSGERTSCGIQGISLRTVKNSSLWSPTRPLNITLLHQWLFLSLLPEIDRTEILPLIHNPYRGRSAGKAKVPALPRNLPEGAYASGWPSPVINTSNRAVPQKLGADLASGR